jgi:hypothetical protein
MITHADIQSFAEPPAMTIAEDAGEAILDIASAAMVLGVAITEGMYLYALDTQRAAYEAAMEMHSFYVPEGWV